MYSTPRASLIALIVTCSYAFLVTAALLAQPVAPAPTTQGAAPTTTVFRERPTSGPASWLPRHAGPWDASLHMARSKDGLTFEAVAEPIIRYASAPTMTRLADGRLLLVFEHYPRTDRRLFGGLGFSLSSDNGKTWSNAQPLEIEDLSRTSGSPRSPALAVKPDGSLELLFLWKNKSSRGNVLSADLHVGRAGQSPHSSASSQPAQARDEAGLPDGSVAVKLSGRAALAEKALSVDDIAAAFIGEQCHLFGTLADIGTQRYHGTSTDGLRFRRLENLPVAEVGTGGAVVTTPNGLRLYASCREGVMSAVSADGSKWSPEPGLRLRDGEDPAVVKLGDGSWLMVYAKGPTAAQAKRRRKQQTDEREADAGVAYVEPPAGPLPGNEGALPPAAMVDEGTAGEAIAVEQPVLDESDQGETDSSIAGDAADAATPVGMESNPAAAQLAPDQIAGAEAAQMEPGTLPPETLTDFQRFNCTATGVPIPDFVNQLDYLAWYQAQHDPASIPDNSWFYYADLLLDPQRGPLSESPLPPLSGMYNDAGFVGPPVPWDPAQHPEWEQAYNTAAPYLTRFADAASHQNYIRPVLFASGDPASPQSADQQSVSEDERFNSLLLNIILPNLAGHRTLVKQTMSDAWRAPDGRPDPQAMINAFDTCLSASNHLGQSDTLIERLVAISEKSLVEKDARFALQHGVFSAEQLETALETLIAKDLPPADPGQWIVGETAMCMETTQYLFGVGEEGGGKNLRLDRIQRLTGLINEENQSRTPTPEELAVATPDRVTRNFTDFYQKFTDMARQGYPAVRAKDIEEMTQPHVEDNYVSRFMLPSLARAYQISTRAEASRRATQISYAVHLYKAQTGQWPQSLNDLPPRYTQGARTDPFSGQDFVYRRTQDGFTLYSTSENGTDDRGIHHRWGDGGTPADPGDDFVFWPPR